jgi:hypothetical protein
MLRLSAYKDTQNIWMDVWNFFRSLYLWDERGKTRKEDKKKKKIGNTNKMLVVRQTKMLSYTYSTNPVIKGRQQSKENATSVQLYMWANCRKLLSWKVYRLRATV